MDPKLRAIIEQVKVDILAPAQEADNEAQLKEVSRSFFSDTITVPTKAMYEYAVRASVGDAVFREPCTSAFEEHMAQLTGKEAALFVSSGTLGNQLAIRTHLLQPPFSILTDVRSHINSYEAGGAAMHSGAYPIPVTPSNGHHLTLEDIKAKAVLGSDIHFAPTHLICLENTLNGMIFPQNDIIKIAKFARENDILMHLDGARLWHVAVETRLPLSELCAPFDSASLCLSKGLGAPIGTCLVGSKVFINKACWFRKAFGGGMRQTGILAASAAYALSHNFPQLPRVHALARRLQRGLEELGVGILCPAETCMVFFDPSTIGVEYGEVERHAAALPEPITLKGSRLVVHIQTTVQAIDDFLRLVSELRDEKVKEGFILSTSQTFANGMTRKYLE
ncbi:pyridoxal phosphate-dependent transferase [Boletus reticuloceps]|uniref:Pyridoxal phosphate-dependent transferase n=1 Tax=Boletus reticuloceps TaxID=495285 RepID=A0A8I2YH73_9AGAM|nr:pyridoxal phosphate-dependent transferase [Boletus reticuloceps]